MFVCELSESESEIQTLYVAAVDLMRSRYGASYSMAYSFAIANGMSSQPEYMPPYLPQFDLRCAVCVREPC